MLEIYLVGVFAYGSIVLGYTLASDPCPSIEIKYTTLLLTSVMWPIIVAAAAVVVLTAFIRSLMKK